MTTIAYDGRYIAIDSRITCGNWISSDEFNKTTETDDWVLFWTGNLDKKEEFELAFLNNGKVNEPSESSLYAFRKNNGKLFDVCSMESVIVKTPITYIDAKGSGACHAITAMDLGKSAVEAIQNAIRRNNSTGGIIRCYDTKTKKFIKVNK